MVALPSPAQSEFYESPLPVKRRLVEVLAIDPAHLKNDRLQSQRRGLGKRASIALTRLLITFGTGVAATLVWLSHGDAARETIASSFPRLGWLALQTTAVGQRTPDITVPAVSPADYQQLNAMSLDDVWQRVDQLTASQKRMAQNMEQLTVSQEQLTREITKLNLIEQYVLYKNSEPSVQHAAPAPTPRRGTQLAH